MIEAIIRLALKYRLLVILLFVGVCVGGVLALTRIPIDAFPDISPNLVQVFAEIEGAAAEEVEQLVSRPVEVAMMGIPGVKKIRTLSSPGLATVNVYFNDDVDIYLAHQLVSERITHAAEDIPEGLDMPHGLEKGPIVSGMGKILSYYLVGEDLDLTELRQLQDWVVKRSIQSVPGVGDVISQGGHVRQFQVRASPVLLLKYDLTLGDLAEAIRRGNSNVGAGIVARGSE
ncbi:MAG: efflux RND transporter permease subunit, partial [bacterium]